MKRQLLVAALENGTVIDHIPCDKVFQVINLLHLEVAQCAVGRIQENEAIIFITHLDSEFIERALEQSAVQSPAIVGDVVVTHYRIEGQEYGYD
jgi:aspartate carbamoyltransferase regulatory subunit